MDFGFTPEQERFRQEVREFLEQELTPDIRRKMEEEENRREEPRYSPEFSRKLGKKGWIGLAWPRKYGGQGLGYIERLVYEEEMCLAGAPTGHHHAAERQFGPSIILHGTEEQKRGFLPRIARGEMSIAIGYSERNSGSDLAALECSAVEDGDDYVVNGHKLWQSAHLAEWIWTAVRTNPAAPKHKGISILLIDLKLPGITVTPVQLMGAPWRKDTVTFENVRVPRKYLVGEKDRGWYVLAANLDFERAGVELVTGARLLFEDIVRVVVRSTCNGAPLSADLIVRHTLARLATEIQVGRLLCYRIACLLNAGKVPNLEAAMAKCYNSELVRKVSQVGLSILGLHGTLSGGEHSVLEGRLQRAWLSLSDTYAAGPVEIMRNVIAIRGLGLPRA